MLIFLSIQNIVLIEKAEIKFSIDNRHSALCILSGETGSGKSILLDALGLVIGFRSNFRLIGSDNKKAIINAEFDISTNEKCQNFLAENDLLDAENPFLLRIRRIIQEGSSGKIYLNDHIIGVNFLAKIGEFLIEIHGQHDQRGLLNPSAHLDILDEFCSNDDPLKKLKKIYEELKETDKQIAELRAKKEATEKEKDYLHHIVQELENADLKSGEEQELTTKKQQLGAKEKILNFITELKTKLLEANSQLLTSQRILIRNQNLITGFLTEKEEFFEKLSEEIDKQNDQISSTVLSLEQLFRNLNDEKNNLEEIEERLFYLKSLARKFSVSIDELPKIIEESKEKLKLISNEEETNLGLEKQRSYLVDEYKKIAGELSDKRKKSAISLAKKVEEELKFLKMENVKFLVAVNSDDDSKSFQKYSISGYDTVRFLAATNNGNFDEISKIASGGELSRFMLALKVALMNVKSVPTIIFDEIDTGIGGSTADAVGNRLKSLSKNLQILVVTHQPQIAAKADLHFKISKIFDDKKVITTVEKLAKKDRQIEIARMLSGAKITNEAMAAAEKLITN